MWNFIREWIRRCRGNPAAPEKRLAVCLARECARLREVFTTDVSYGHDQEAQVCWVHLRSFHFTERMPETPVILLLPERGYPTVPPTAICIRQTMPVRDGFTVGELLHGSQADMPDGWQRCRLDAVLWRDHDDLVHLLRVLQWHVREVVGPGNAGNPVQQHHEEEGTS